MEIIYRASDGKEFTNKQECINYETAFLNNGFVMYDVNGKTKDFQKCWVIDIKEENPYMFEYLEILCRHEGCGYEGLALGLNIYDIDAERWVNPDHCVLLALEQYFKDKGLEN